jgi:hypothetical protein
MQGPNNNTKWTEAITEVLLKIQGFGIAGIGVGEGSYNIPRKLKRERMSVYIMANSASLYIEADEEPTQTHVDNILAYFRKRVYQTWIYNNDLKKENKALEHVKIHAIKGKKIGQPVSERQRLKERIKSQTEFAHDERSTIVVAGIIKAVEDEFNNPERYPGMDYDWVKNSIIDDIQKLLKIDYKEEPFYDSKGNFKGVKRIITGEVKKQTGKERTDKAGLRNLGGKDKGIDAILEQVVNNLNNAAIIHPDKALDFEGSPTFRQQAAQAAQYNLLKEIMLKNKKYIGLTKIKTKKLKPKPKNISIKKAETLVQKATKQRAKAGRKRPVSLSVEKGQGREASTNEARELARLTKYINSRLGAEVRRKHGTEGMLKQQSGIFSRSVKLESLHQSANSVVAKYSYMLTGGGVSKNREGVYQTFENTGVKKWRLSYNPKNIITKSIRSLAEAEIKKKFGKQLRFRRV